MQINGMDMQSLIIKDQHLIESLLLGAMLEFPKALKYFSKRLSAEDFSNPYNRLIYETVLDMSGTIDISKIYTKLAANQMALEGVAAHLADLNSMNFTANREDNRLSEQIMAYQAAVE